MLRKGNVSHFATNVRSIKVLHGIQFYHPYKQWIPKISLNYNKVLYWSQNIRMILIIWSKIVTLTLCLCWSTNYTHCFFGRKSFKFLNSAFYQVGFLSSHGWKRKINSLRSWKQEFDNRESWKFASLIYSASCFLVRSIQGLLTNNRMCRINL